METIHVDYNHGIGIFKVTDPETKISKWLVIDKKAIPFSNPSAAKHQFNLLVNNRRKNDIIY